MISTYIQSIFQYSISQSEKFTSNKYWMIWMSLFCSLLVILFSYPNYNCVYNDPYIVKAWDAIMTQVDNPFQHHEYFGESHQSKLAFRLSVPLIAHLLHLSVFGIICLQYIFGILLFYISSKVIKEITKDNFITFIITLSLAFIYSGKVSFLELRGAFDGFALFFLLLALYKKNVFLIASSVLITSLTDERGLIACSFVFIYWYIHESNSTRKFFTKQTVSVVIGGAIYILTRLSLAHFFGLKTQSAGIGLQVLASNLNLIPLGIWHGLEGFWIFLIIAIITLLFKKEKLVLFLFISATFCVILASCLVSDVTRSAAFLFPAIFVALKIMIDNDSILFTRKIALLTLFCCFIYPAYFSGGGYRIEWTYPFPVRFIFNYFAS
jgi:hypothetical protein